MQIVWQDKNKITRVIKYNIYVIKQNQLSDITNSIETKQEGLENQLKLTDASMFWPAVLVFLNACFVMGDKRLVLHSELDIAEEFRKLNLSLTHVKTRVTQQEAEIKAQEAEIKAQASTIKQLVTENQHLKAFNGGATYTRWGRLVCPGNGTTVVYKGYTGGSMYSGTGGGSNNICLPMDPTWNQYKDGVQSMRGGVYGTEVDIEADFSKSAFSYEFWEQDLPCTVCQCARPNVLMVPGRTTCYPGWTLEYSGYLMTGVSSKSPRTDYVCVDERPEALPHGGTNDNQHILYFTEAHCGSLPCPPYHEGRELACVVCSL